MAARASWKGEGEKRNQSIDWFCERYHADIEEFSNAATFNTFIQTCKQMGVPFMSYFKKVMNELKNGRTDYQNLLPATIQL